MDNSVIVSLRDIVVEFDGQRILDGLNLDIHDKEFVTLLGSSGCGKTTTLRLIAGFLEPNAGQVLLKGRDITGVPPYKRPVNTVFQKYALFPHLNVFENVELPLKYLNIGAGERKRRVTEILKRMNISHRAQHFPQQLSGGQQQRVAIARAVVSNPKLVLADEPTGNLDSRNGKEVMDLLTELNSEGTTIVMVTHSQKDASVAQRTINLFDGQVVTEANL